MPEPPSIAVVGASCLLPGAQNLDELWRNLLTGRDLMKEVPPTHWLVEDYYDPDPSAPDKTYARRGAFLDPVEFEPLAFGTPPDTLAATDTSQLLGLIAAKRVLEDASGGALDRVPRERTGVVLGTAALELLGHMAARLQRPVWIKSLREAGIPESRAQEVCERIASHYVPWTEATFPGLLGNVVAGRIANRFDLHGPNFITDAACASSLAAISMAVNELVLGHCDVMLTGGVDTLNDITMYMCFSKTPALSRSGDCRPFSDAADGTMLGEGVVLFALKRLADAEVDGDRIYAVIKGIGAGSDGSGGAIYAPRPEGQARALTRAYAQAGYGPDTVELVEAHGTGTVAGDAAEVAALRTVFEEWGRADRQWCALGSIKSQIGHTKGTAGAAGLLKAALSLHQKALPPTLKVDRPNPALDLESSPLYLNTQARPWIRGGHHPRRASVSSFGFGGSNFHVTLEEYRPAEPSRGRAARALRAMPSELVVVSADSSQELAELLREDLGESSLAEIARRSQKAFDPSAAARLAVIASDACELADRFAQAAASIEDRPNEGFTTPSGSCYSPSVPEPGRVAFLFSGQGSQYVGMGADLAVHFPAAREAWDESSDWDLRDDEPLHRVVFPVPASSEEQRRVQEERLTAAEWAQPALAVQCLAQLAVLGRLGVRPDCAAGHSFGELVALHAAGTLDAEALVRLARKRGELVRDTGVAGAMLAVECSADRVENMLTEGVWIANLNAPDQAVVSGDAAAIAAVERACAAEGVTARRLRISTAFHTPLMKPAAEGLHAFLTGVDLRSPGFEVYSNLDAAPHPPDLDALRDRLGEHLARPVRFAEQIEAMYKAGVRTFVEIGAGSVLTGLTRAVLGGREYRATSLDRRRIDGVTSLYQALAVLAVHGLSIDFAGLWAGYEPPVRLEDQERPTMTLEISGANHARSYPPPGGATALPAPNPEPAQQADGIAPAHYEPAPTASARFAADPAWLHTVSEVQRQTAEAHAAYQRAMAESHTAFLRTAETSFQALTSLFGGTQVSTALVAPSTTIASPTPLPELDVAPSAPPATNGYPPAPRPVAEPVTAATEDLETVMLGVVAKLTGYPVDMLGPQMELDTDLGIDSIKRVQILSALRERVPDLPAVDAAELGKLHTIGEIADALRSALAGSAPPPFD